MKYILLGIYLILQPFLFAFLANKFEKSESLNSFFIVLLSISFWLVGVGVWLLSRFFLGE